MGKRNNIVLFLFLSVFFGAVVWAPAQKFESGHIVLHRTVDLVQLDVAVMDKKGNYVSGLRPWNFTVYEDGIREKLATFGEENQAPRRATDFAPLKQHQDQLVTSSPARLSSGVGRSVFILFDTSNYMYRGFVFAQDAIGEFVRSLDRSDRVAFYSYSRDFSRGALLTSDRMAVLRGVRATVAGDDAALYDSLLLTLEDAGQFTGRKVIVVFSNGPDNASMVAPEDVLELAQSEGIPIYMVSTQRAKIDPVSTAVFERMSAATGGKAYFAKNWEDQQKAFASIRDDLAHLYSLSYYPQPNPNRGWRKITVKLVGVNLKKYRIRTRSGYRPEAVRVTDELIPPS
ncbi:MAG TPA: VWA domain-containing protein [Terriglobia bacterium]|nr:VWA domain-containing protein [Terriglobia bacterium]